MTPAVEQLVRETMDVTGAEMPALLEADAPVLSEKALAQDVDADRAFYLVGIIGGKDVGKSALVNALVGHDITAISSHGPGTEGVVAYAHSTQKAALRALLEREVPGRYRVVGHQIAGLERQVVLDLPDIDSHYESHAVVTRTMLRHMLYPIWVQSVEKYADLQPQQMLARVAAGNAAQNFVFVLTKADQIAGLDPGAGEALREDFGARAARTLAMTASPRVFLVSSRRPEEFDLPALRALLWRQKSPDVVRESKDLAARRQDRSLADWLGAQDLRGRAERIGRLQLEAEELAAARLAVPLVERVLPRIALDPTHRSALADEILADRVTRWPLVSLVHTVLAPLAAVLRTVGARNAATLQGADALVDFHLRGEGWSPASAVQSTFAHLRQAQPMLADLYRHHRLWESLPSEEAAGELSRRLTLTVERQRQVARERLAGRGGILGSPVRWALTIGALLWFPLIQPVLEGVLRAGEMELDLRVLAGRVVSVLSADYLLRSAGFLAIYFAVLWLALRWNTQRKVTRLLGRWRSVGDEVDESIHLPAQALQWVDGLTDPLRRAHLRLADLADRAEAIRVTADRAA